MKTVTFFSNYLNHHQLDFCKELDVLTNNNFKFVCQKAISQKRISFGYQTIVNDYDFTVKTYESKEELQKAYELAVSSDYVMYGSSNEDYLKERLKQNKLIIKYSERLFKEEVNLLNYLRSYRRVYVNHTKYKNKKMYMLCSSSFAAYDFNRFGAYKNKTYKWGYFPVFEKLKEDDLIRNNKRVTLLWAGRMLNWKHPEYPILLAKKLKENKIDFDLNMIGNGEMEEEIKKSILENNLQNNVHILGSMTPIEVRKHMKQADIFLFTSGKREGWGAVLNEAMNSGCACVADHMIGSVGFLIKNNENGFIYKDGDFNDFYQKVVCLIEDQSLRQRIGINAYKTIAEEWNGKEAAKRFLKLCECLDSGKESPYISGPCSAALPIKDNKMYEYLKTEK